MRERFPLMSSIVSGSPGEKERRRDGELGESDTERRVRLLLWRVCHGAQLWINTANERLQQSFNHIVFKQQQTMYKAEGIAWEAIAYRDNSDRIDLISAILTVLNDECRLPRATDDTFAEKLYTGVCARACVCASVYVCVRACVPRALQWQLGRA